MFTLHSIASRRPQCPQVNIFIWKLEKCAQIELFSSSPFACSSGLCYFIFFCCRRCRCEFTRILLLCFNLRLVWLVKLIAARMIHHRIMTISGKFIENLFYQTWREFPATCRWRFHRISSAHTHLCTHLRTRYRNQKPKFQFHSLKLRKIVKIAPD